LQNLNYVYDKVGNITTLTNTPASEKNTYRYDSLNRLRCWGLTTLSGTSGCKTYNPATDQFGGSLSGTDAEYAYNSATGNLALKDNLTLSYGDAAMRMPVKTLSNGNSCMI
jgi:YD repeat-containing protein